MNGMNNDVLRNALIEIATSAVAAFPQYKPEAFRAMTLCRGKRTVATKAGVALQKGEAVLVDVGTLHYTNGRGFVTIWSNSNKVHTSVPVAALELA